MNLQYSIFKDLKLPLNMLNNSLKSVMVAKFESTIEQNKLHGNNKQKALLGWEVKILGLFTLIS